MRRSLVRISGRVLVFVENGILRKCNDQNPTTEELKRRLGAMIWKTATLEYIVNLLRRVIYLSCETVKTVKSLPKIDFF